MATLAAVTASVAACTALLDLQSARFDADGGGAGNGTIDGNVDGNGDVDGNTTIDVEPDAGNTTKCTITRGEGDGAVTGGNTMCPSVGLVDLTTNPQHCGECGHGCGGAGCTKGQCDAPSFLPESDSPAVLGATATHLAWSVSTDAATAATLRVSSLDGGDVRTLGVLDGTFHTVGGLTSEVLFVPRQTVAAMVYPLDGGAPFPVGGNNPSLYVVTRGNEAFFESYEANLKRLTLVPDASAKILYEDDLGVISVAVAGPYLYWVSNRGPDDAGLHPAIGRVHIDTQVIAFSKWRGASEAIAVDGAYVYVFDSTKQDLVRLPLDLSGDGETLMHWTGVRFDSATTIIPDGDFIYVRANAGGSAGAVLRVPRCGGAPFIVKELLALGRVAIAGGYVYWGDLLEPGVKRVPK